MLLKKWGVGWGGRRHRVSVFQEKELGGTTRGEFGKLGTDDPDGLLLSICLAASLGARPS